MNPMNELFSTKEAIDYINAHGKAMSIPYINKAKNKFLGRLLTGRQRVYFKRELDAFCRDQPYNRDDADIQQYEQSILDTILTTDQASEYAGLTTIQLRRLCSTNKIEHWHLGNTLIFLPEWIDKYRDNRKLGRPIEYL